MRDPSRLYYFYNELMRVHMENFPDMRFGQFICNFEAWLLIEKNMRDIFYIEEDEILLLMNEFIGKRIKR